MTRYRDTFGAWLRQRRADAGLTLERLARVAGVSPQYLSEIERDRRAAPPPAGNFDHGAVADALGVRLEPMLARVRDARQHFLDGVTRSSWRLRKGL